jgi:hypothetical protein
MASGADDDYRSALGRTVRKSWPGLLAVCLVGVAGAWTCYRRQRQYAASGTWLWVAFVFLGGIPGLLAYLVHRAWPARLPCDACGAAAPRDRPSCAFCRADFPLPKRRGTEVFSETVSN